MWTWASFKAWVLAFGQITFGLEGIVLAPVFLRPSIDGLNRNTGQASFTLENGGSASKIASSFGGVGTLKMSLTTAQQRAGYWKNRLQMVRDVRGRVSVCPLSQNFGAITKAHTLQKSQPLKDSTGGMEC
jgi:hypothetical protein